MPNWNKQETGLGHRSWRGMVGGVTPQKLVFLGFLGIAGFFLFTEHRAHVFGALPWVLLLLCPLMHVFMHGGHEHGSAGADKSDSAHEHREGQP